MTLRHRCKLSLAALTCLATGAIGLAVAAGPAAATLGPSQSWTTPGSYTWTVPADVHTVAVVAEGAQGGDGYSTTGGAGGRETATIAVTPGEALTVVVGGAAAAGAGGSNGGGNPDYSAAGGGGGGSDVRQGGVTLADRVVVAGGGGGAGSYGAGADGGLGGGTDGAATPYGSASGQPGHAGTASAGGAGGSGAFTDPSFAGSDGTFGVGGDGGSFLDPGAGGGGGWYGGGGSGGGDIGSGGGGGGSNYAIPSATSVVSENGVNSGDGSVTISWTATPTTTIPTTTTVPHHTTTTAKPAPRFTCPTWAIRVDRNTLWAVNLLRWVCWYQISQLHNGHAVVTYIVPFGWHWRWTVNPHGRR